MSSPASTWERIAALARRDARVERTYHFQLVMRYASIAFSVAVFYFIGKLVAEPQALEQFEGGYFSFVLVGLIVSALAAVGLKAVIQAVASETSAGTLEILLAGDTPLRTVVAGSLLVPFGLGLIETALYLAIGWALAGEAYGLVALLSALPIVLLTVGTFIAIGILAAAFLILTKRGEPFTALALQASSLLAGTLFPVAVLPMPLQVAAHLLPAFYGLRGIRAILLAGQSLADVWFDVVVLIGFNLVLLPLSMMALRKALRVAKVTGILATG